MWQKIKPHIPLLSILTLAALLRLIAVFKYGDFWDDEMFNFIYSQKSWPQGLVYWLWETNPPLHLLVLKIWLYFFPAIEFFARLPSVIAGVATVYVIYKFGEEIFSKKTAYIAALYLAIHPYHIFWSATARIYAIFMLLAICSVWFFFRTYFIDNNRHNRRCHAVANLFLIFAHLSSVFLLAGQFVSLIILKGKTAAIDWIKLNLLPGIIGLIWILASLAVKSGNDLGSAWFLNMAHSFTSAVNPLINIIAGQYPIYAGIILVGASVILLSGATIKKIQAKDNRFIFLLIIALTPIALSFACDVWHIKFFLSALPLVVLALAESLSIAFKKLVSSLMIIAVVCSIGLYRLWITLPLTDWKNIELFYVNHAKDKTALVYNNYILKSQIDRYLPNNISAPALPLLLYENMGWDDMVVKKNYLFIQLSKEKIDDWYAEHNLDNFEKIILLQGEYNYMNRLTTTLEDNGWKKTDGPERARLSGYYNLYFYEKN
ncbi:MAG: glycosyltransferase family 39 protein [Candidatus Magasanikbacteria bacterium]|nr:glycosyltransferase family 39 protein [Candidatus Magasanikbacteria bacterium]